MRRVLVLVVLVGTAVLSAFFMVSAYWRARQEAVDQLYAQERILASQAAEGITAYFDYYRETLLFLASNADVASNSPAGQRLLRDLFAAQRHDLLSITRVNQDGRIVYTFPEEGAIGRSILDQPHVLEVRSTRRPVLSRVFTSVQGFECVALHVPVFEGGVFAGSLAALIPFDRVSEQYLEGVRLGRSGHALLLSREGIELFCPSPGHTRRSIFETNTTAPDLRAMAERMLRGETGRAVYEFRTGDAGDGPVAYHAYFTRIPLEGTYWSIAVVAEAGEALAFFQGFRNRWIAGFTLLFVATLGWGAVVARSYVKLQRERARQVAQERVQAAEHERERALRESEERFRTYFEGSPLPMAITSPAGEWVAVNDRLTECLGYTRDELFALGWEHLSHPDDARVDASAYERMLAGAIDHYSVEKRFARKDGAIVHTILSARLVRRADGSPDYCLTQLQDITDRKRLDDERTRLEEQLRQSQKLEAIGRLAGGIAHDYNNLLAVQLGHLSMLREEGALAPDVRTALAEVEKSAAMAAQLTRQLLAFGRRQVLQIRRIDVNDVVRSVTQLVERVLPEGIILEVRAAEEAVWVDVDPGSLEQVVMNLVVNARDAMPFGGRLTVATCVVSGAPGAAGHASAPPSGKFACLSVTDTGTGMSEGTRARIFEPFFTTKDAGQGTGLGLATVYGIVRQHDGWIEVDSQEGRGSTFRVGLKLAPSAGQAPLRRDAPAFDGQQQVVLVAEDDNAVRGMLSKALGRLKCRVVAAASAAQALELWRQHGDEVRMLVSDMMMVDGENGLELARALRRDRPDLAVVIMSGHSEELVGASLDAGMVFLAKPWTHESLVTALATAMSASAPAS